MIRASVYQLALIRNFLVYLAEKTLPSKLLNFEGITQEDENSRLKRILADLTLDREMLQDVIRRKV